MVGAAKVFGLALSLAVSLAWAPRALARPTAPAEPSLPAIVTFHLWESKGAAGLTLSFALPGMIEYECRYITHREDFKGQEITVTFVGVAVVDNEQFCRLAKEPPPIVESITLPASPGAYRIVFRNEARSDAYKLVTASDKVELEPEGRPQFTNSDEVGTLFRVGSDWLWADFSFFADDSRRKMARRRDEVLNAIVALGAKPFTPPPGRYLLNGFARRFPADPPGDRADEEYVFKWAGDWRALQQLAHKYRKYSAVNVGKPVMQFWLISRDNVVSTGH